jgi:hypothetical protein
MGHLRKSSQENKDEKTPLIQKNYF